MRPRTLATSVNVLLIGLLALTVWILATFNSNPDTDEYGRDFVHFYAAGSIASQGQAARLYDQDYFREMQEPVLGPDKGFYSLYPPILALLMAPLAQLPYAEAVKVWWFLQGLCFLGAALLLRREMAVLPPWRGTALLALATLYPMSLTFMFGHLSALLLLLLTAGLTLHRHGRRLAAGGLLSVLSLKPQFAAGVLIWLLLRRDLRTGVGMLLGLSLQAAAVGIALGPGVILAYFENLPAVAQIAKDFRYSAVFEQSFAGMLGNLLDWLGYRHQEFTRPCMWVQMVIAACSGFLLFRVIRAGRRFPQSSAAAARAWRHEHAAAVLFLLLLTPHLLVYDLALLAIPIVHLWSTSRWLLGIGLYLSATILLALVYLQLGFSLVPFLALLALYQLASRLPPPQELPRTDCCLAAS